MSLPPADWPNRLLSRSVRVGGIDWHVQESGEGPVLLLLHGTGAATHSWRAMLPPLAKHFRVIAPDLPGHGFTERRPVGGLTMTAVSRSVTAMLGEMEAEPALVVGHSAGAAIAMRMTLDGLIAPLGIVALAPALLPFPGIAQHLFPTMAKLLFANPFAPHIFASVARGPGAVARFLTRSTGSNIDAAGIGAYARLFGTSAHCAGAIGMMADWDLVPLKRDLPKLGVPVLMVGGAQDSAIPVSAVNEAAALLPRATVEIVQGAGHLLHEEHPAQTVTRIFDFAAACGVAVHAGEAA